MLFAEIIRSNSGAKMFLSVQQCVRNTLPKNKKILLLKEFTTYTQTPKHISVVRFSHYLIKNRTVNTELWKLNTFNSRQFLNPLSSCFYSTDNRVDCEGNEKPEKKLSLYQKFKKAFKEYWYIILPVHIVTSVIWYGGFYYMAASGFDIPSMLETFGAPENWIHTMKNSKAGNYVIAFTLYKLFSPLRYMVTLGGTTIIVNVLLKRGWIKPKPFQLKKMINAKKGALKASCQDKMQVTKKEFLKTKLEVKQKYLEVKEGLNRSLQETRDGFKEGMKGGADEWKHIGRVLSRGVKDGLDTVTNYKKKKE